MSRVLMMLVSDATDVAMSKIYRDDTDVIRWRYRQGDGLVIHRSQIRVLA